MSFANEARYERPWLCVGCGERRSGEPALADPNGGGPLCNDCVVQPRDFRAPVGEDERRRFIEEFIHRAFKIPFERNFRRLGLGDGKK